MPAGAEDLGFGTFIPVPEGWTTERLDANTVFIRQGTGNDSNAVYVSVAVRPAGDDPQDYVETYVHEIDRRVASVPIGFATSRRGDDLAGEIDSRVIEISYSPYNAPTLELINPDWRPQGDVFVYQRADGLSAIYDRVGGAVPSDNSKRAFEKAFVAAPAIGPSSALGAVEPFLLESPTHPNLHVTDSVSFAVATDFAAIPATSGVAVARGDCRFTAAHLSDIADAVAAQAAAVTAVASFVPGAVPSGWEEPRVTRDGRITSMFAMWATSPTAEAELVAVLVLFDATTHNAILVMSADPIALSTMGCQEDINFMMQSLLGALPDPID